jgi:hypothetical protein
MKILFKKYSKLSIIILFFNLFFNFSILAQTKAVSVNYKSKV